MQIKNYYDYGTQIKLSIKGKKNKKGIMGCFCGIHVVVITIVKLLDL